MLSLNYSWSIQWNALRDVSQWFESSNVLIYFNALKQQYLKVNFYILTRALFSSSRH